MLAADGRHWWYRGRRQVVRAVLERVVPTLPAPGGELPGFLDAGCGSGRMLSELARFGRACGVDMDAHSVEIARSRGHEAVRGSLTALPFHDSTWSLAICLDVIEHLDDDRAGLRELRRVVEPGGAAIITVPAYQLLWGRHDELNEHRRRYSRATLARAARDAGWDVEWMTGFNSLLLAPAAAVRLSERLRPRRPDAPSDLALSPAALDPLLELPMRLEARRIARGRTLPVGLSLLCVLRRPGQRLALPEPLFVTAGTGA